MQLTTTTTTATAAADGRAADEASQFSQLPQALLTCVLHFVPQQERLNSCALVCKSWAAAAAAATVEVDASFEPPRHVSVFEPWLEQHAGQLVSLRVKTVGSSTEAEFHLPICQLQQLSPLDLDGLQVDSGLAAGSSSSTNNGITTMLAKLQELRLHRCKFSHSSMLQQAQLSGVTHFDCAHPLDFEDAQHLLQGLPNLKELHLVGQADTADIMPVLPPHSLTVLTLYHNRVKFPDSASRLVNLRELQLHQTTELSLVALASMTLLTRLRLTDCQPAAGVDGTIPGFLAAVRGLRQLQRLEVWDSVQALLRAAEPHACAALTAPSQLSFLEIYTRQGGGQPLPATALQHMFPAGKQLPRLKALGINSYGHRWDEGCITTAELSSLIAACPALYGLDLTCALAADADVSALLKLPQQCQHLYVGGDAFGDKAAGVVAQLTQLRTLGWGGSHMHMLPRVTYAGLARLTALHALDSSV